MQQLEHHRRGLAGRSALGQSRGQRRAGAAAADSQSGGVETDFNGGVDRPPQYRQGVVGGGGERMLRSQSVFGRDHGAPAPSGEFHALAVIGVEVTEHKGARMEVEQRGRRGRCAAVDPDTHRLLCCKPDFALLDLHADVVDGRCGLGPPLVERVPHRP